MIFFVPFEVGLDPSCQIEEKDVKIYESSVGTDGEVGGYYSA